MINPIKANMNEVSVNGVKILYSYQTPVAVKQEDQVLVTETKYFVTTSRHINEYLKMNPNLNFKKVSQSEINKFVNP